MRIQTKKFDDLVKVVQQKCPVLFSGHRNIKIDSIRKTVSFHTTNYNSLDRAPILKTKMTYRNGWDLLDPAKNYRFSLHDTDNLIFAIDSDTGEKIAIGSIPYITKEIHDALRAVVAEGIKSETVTISRIKTRTRDKVKTGALAINFAFEVTDFYDD